MNHPELAELRTLYGRLRHGEALSLPEAQRFEALVDRLKRDRPDNEGTWVLAGLAALALGFAMGAAVAKPNQP